MKKLISFMAFFLTVAVAFSQRTVKGTVTDQSEPLIGATVLITGTSIGTVTDVDGFFEIEVPDDATQLTISYTGFAAKTVDITGLSQVNVILDAGQVLDEVVVTALGVTRDEKALGYAVQQVGAETISKANTVNAIDALAGSAAGVQITQSNGAAGASSRIILRGQTSFNGNNEALIVVDGIRLNNDENTTERELQGVANSNRAIDINPNDIESISVLKGAAATALYGIEGARGVVLITTKRGGSKELKVDVSTNVTFSRVSNIQGLQNEYAQGSGGVWQGPETGQSGSWGPLISDLYFDGDDTYKWDSRGRLTTDPTAGPQATPIDNVGDFFETGIRSNTNVAFSGGTNAANYRFSFGASNEDGVTPSNEFDRYNVGINLGSKLFDNRLDIGINANYVRTSGVRIQQGSNTSGIMLGLLRTTPTFDNAAGLSDPVNGVDANGNSAYQFADGTQRNYRGGIGYDNPYWTVNNALFNDQVNRFYGSLRASYTFHEWFRLGTLIGTDTYADNRIQRFEIGSRNLPDGQVIEDNYNYRHIDAYFNVSGNGSLTQDLTLSYQLGINLYDEKLKQNYIQGDGLNFLGFAELGNTSTISTQITNTNERTAGIYGTIDIGFRNFLYLTLTGRNDWSSTLVNPLVPFNAGDISFFYPSVSLGFIASELFDSKTVSYLKFRASYAEVGGGSPSAYSTSTPWQLPLQNAGTIFDINDGWTNGLGFPFKGTSGFVLSTVAGNPLLKPSRTKDIETGFDLRLFNNRIGIDGTFYTRKSEDQIIAINISNTSGFQRAFVNSGELQTVGGEIILNVNPVRTKDLDWNVAFNFSKWKTTVESLPPGVQTQFLDGFTGTQINNIAPETDADGNVTRTYEYGQILGGAFQRVNTPEGIFDPNAEYNPDGALIIQDDPSQPGYGFPIADPSQRVIGNPNPDFLLGITNTLSYKGATLSFLFDIREGGDIWNGTRGALTVFGMTEETAEKRGTVTVFDGIGASSGSANDIAVTIGEAWYQGNGGGFGAVDEQFVEDASFMRLRYLTLGYDLKRVLNLPGFDNFNISFTGRNLLLITPYTGFDPELSLVGSSSNGQGLDYFQLPNVRSYSIGLNATF
ncbi:MAG: SusC/RagA family TonB-linked outer membrane protein [Bacteroidota bacterium]